MSAHFHAHFNDQPRDASPPRGPLRAGLALRDLAAVLPASLVPPTALPGLQQLADRLPFTTGAGLECPFDSAGSAGWSIRFRTGEERRWLAHPEPARWGFDLEQEPWPRIRELGERWEQHDAAWPLRNVCLEFDSGQHPCPSVFFDTGGPARTTAADPWFWAGLVELLRGQRLRGEVRQCAAACLDAVPAAGFLGYVGVMLGRADAGLRFTIDGLDAADATLMIGRLIGRGRLPALTEALALVAPLQPRVVLHVDVDDQLGPVIGAELFARAGARDPRGAWRQLLEPLLAHLDRSSFVEPLMQWMGVSAAVSLGPGHHLLRRVNHIKIVAREGSPLSGKAYLYYGLWQTRPGASQPGGPAGPAPANGG